MSDDVYADYEAMSQAAAQYLLSFIAENPNALLCLATGSSPKRMYALIAAALRADDLDVSRLHCVALDEWYGVEHLHPASCAAYIQEHIVGPWGLAPEQLHTFRADAENPVIECQRIQDYLLEKGPIDLCILGLGRNGHLGLNEPGPSLKANVHVAQLDDLSQSHAMLVDEGIQLSQGMTIGMADIIASKNILLLITGNDKEEVYERLLSGEISTEIPASFLHLHGQVHNFIDKNISE